MNKTEAYDKISDIIYSLWACGQLTADYHKVDKQIREIIEAIS